MARHRQYPPLNVFLNSRLVGQLRREPSGATAFQYDPGWLAWAHTMPVSLSLPLREDAYTGAPVRAVFENLLPDNDELRRRIAARTHADGTDAWSLLSAIGHDCVGALQFLQPGREPGAAGEVDGEPLSSKEIADILANLARNPLGISENQDFRISIAGAQEKTALLRWKDAWLKPRGTTATTHIFKPSIGQLPNGLDLTHSVENEFLCLRLLESLGLPTAKARMSQFGGRSVLIVERFDRHWTEDGRLLRLPQEDFCQALSVSTRPQVRIRRRSRSGSNPSAAARQRYTGRRSANFSQSPRRLLASRRNRRACQELQHLPVPGRPLSNGAPL